MQKRSNPLDRFAKDLRPGTLQWIGLRAERKAPMLEPNSAFAKADYGLDGDHRVNKTPGSGRQVTVISSEFIEQTAHFLNMDAIAPSLLRRNLMISGINLHALRYQRFSIGDALFEAGALCHPCSRMETALGTGGVAAMLGHGGLCCKILHSGTITIGDAVVVRSEGQTRDLFD